MEYILINGHSNISFHDAYINSVYFQDNNMIWELAALQAQNIIQYVCDDNCYIKNATMVLEEAHIESVFIGGYGHYENSVFKGSKESAFAPPNEFDNLFKNISYRNYSYIYDIKELIPAGEGQYKISVMTTYQITIKFAKSLVKWSEFGGVEWYRRKMWTNKHPN